MKKILLFAIISSFAYSQSPNLFSTYLTTGVNSTDTTFYFTPTDSLYAGNGVEYYATIWDKYYASASIAYKYNAAEIIKVNSRSGRKFYVTRGSLGTTARSFNASGRRYQIDVSVYGANFDNSMDSIAALRSDLGTLSSLDSVDIPIICGFSGQTWSAQTTTTAGFDGTFSVQNDSLSSKSSFGINGRVIAMYVQGKLNTLSAPATVTLQYADSSAKVFSSGLSVTIGVNKNFSYTEGQTLNVTPYKIGGFKFVSSSGSGSILLGTITLVVRTKLN